MAAADAEAAAAVRGAETWCLKNDVCCRCGKTDEEQTRNQGNDAQTHVCSARAS